MHDHWSSTIPLRSTACHVQPIVRGIAVGRLSVVRQKVKNSSNALLNAPCVTS
jgi:hypothetical protein